MPILHFFCGRGADAALPLATTAGNMTFALPNAHLSFYPDRPLLLGDADHGRAEWLGSAHGIGPSGLASRLPVRTERAAGARLWQPAEWLALAARRADEGAIAHDFGTHAARTLGGTVIAVQVAAPQRTLALHLRALTPASAAGLLDFLQSATQGGLLPFTWLRTTGTLQTAWLQGGEPLRQSESASDGLVDLTLPLLNPQPGVEP